MSANEKISTLPNIHMSRPSQIFANNILTERGIDFSRLDLETLEWDNAVAGLTSFRAVTDTTLAWVGDWLNMMYEKFGEVSSQVLDASDYDANTLSDAMRVCDRIPFDIRTEGTKFYHWRVVAKLDTKEERKRFLDAAGKNGMTVRDLNDAVKKYLDDLFLETIREYLPEGPFECVLIFPDLDWKPADFDVLKFLNIPDEKPRVLFATDPIYLKRDLRTVESLTEYTGYYTSGPDVCLIGGFTDGGNVDLNMAVESITDEIEAGAVLVIAEPSWAKGHSALSDFTCWCPTIIREVTSE